MSIEKKVDKEDVLAAIQEHYDKYKAVPTVDLLAEHIFHVTPMTIYRKLEQLEHDFKIERFAKTGTYKTGYKLIKF